MVKSDIDWWEVLERGSELVGIVSGIAALSKKDEKAGGLAGAALLARLFCALVAPPKCPQCSTRMKKSSGQDYWLCTVCGFIKVLS